MSDLHIYAHRGAGIELATLLREGGFRFLSWSARWDMDAGEFEEHVMHLARQYPQMSGLELEARAAYRCLTHNTQGRHRRRHEWQVAALALAAIAAIVIGLFMMSR